jgi:hypothetical protein
VAAVREPIASFIKRVKVSSTLNRSRGNLAANNGVDSKSAVRILPDADTQRRDIFTQGSNQLFEDENGRIIPYTQPCSDMFLGTEPHLNGRSAGDSNENDVPYPLSAGSRVVDRKIGDGATTQGARKVHAEPLH